MMTRLYSSTVLGVDGVEVEVEVDFRPMAEKRTFIVGLPDAAVKESGQRVDTAIQNSGLPFQQGVFVVNLAPADLRKQGPGFDLPIALGMVAGAAERDMDASSWCIVGELALDGAVRPVQGILPQIMEARRMGRKRIMLPRANAHEGTPVQGVEIYPVASLKEAWALLTSSVLPPPFTASGREDREAEDKETAVDFDEIKGQPYARRAMEIAAAGGHNILLCGSPGSGKSMLAQRLPTILPPLNPEEALETSKIHSVCGLLKRGNGLVARRPFRAPHHTISDAGLMGGGANITPGEVSLAHNGVLFLDELPEFRRAALETLRQPLESGQVVISRASGTMTFPCRFVPLRLSGRQEKNLHLSPGAGRTLPPQDFRTASGPVRLADGSSRRGPLYSGLRTRRGMFRRHQGTRDGRPAAPVQQICGHSLPQQCGTFRKSAPEALPPAAGKPRHPAPRRGRTGPFRQSLRPHSEGGPHHSGSGGQP